MTCLLDHPLCAELLDDNNGIYVACRVLNPANPYFAGKFIYAIGVGDDGKESLVFKDPIYIWKETSDHDFFSYGVFPLVFTIHENELVDMERITKEEYNNMLRRAEKFMMIMNSLMQPGTDYYKKQTEVTQLFEEDEIIEAFLDPSSENKYKSRITTQRIKDVVMEMHAIVAEKIASTKADAETQSC